MTIIYKTFNLYNRDIILIDMNDNLRGELTIFLSSIFFAIAAVFVKFINENLSSNFISFSRFLIGVIIALILIIIRKEFKIYNKRLLVLRGITGMISMISYFLAIRMSSSGRATLLNTTYPIFVAIYGALFFKERVSKKERISIILCFVGVITVFYDGTNHNIYGDMLGLLSGITGAISIRLIKRLREKNNSIIIYLSACLFGLIATSFSAKEGSMVDLVSLILLIAVGATFFIAQILMNYGFKHVSSTKGSIITYAKVPLVLFFSYLFVSEEMNLKFMIGTIFIVAGLMINMKKKVILAEI